MRLFKLRIGRIEPGLGIEAMALTARQVEALAPEIIGSELNSGPHAPDIAPLIDQLAGRAGETALFRLEATPVEAEQPKKTSKAEPGQKLRSRKAQSDAIQTALDLSSGEDQ